MFNPVAETLAMDTVKKQFEEAVDNNLVMPFSEYKRRYGEMTPEVFEKFEKMPCSPFMFIDHDEVTELYQRGMIVSDVYMNENEEMDVLSVWGVGSQFGFPQITIEDQMEPGSNWRLLRLMYVGETSQGFDEVVEMTRSAVINIKTWETKTLADYVKQRS